MGGAGKRARMSFGRIIMFGMQQFGGPEQGMFREGEPMSEFYSPKQDQQDRSTNHQTPDCPSHFPHAFEISPRSGAFFFAPNSPQPLLPDLLDSARRRPRSHMPPNTASISKKLNLEDDLDELEQEPDTPHTPDSPQPKRGVPNRSQRNAKGLRNLSESVYMIVSELNVTKYKEVADRLVGEITSECGREPGRDEHNIKRRVYDALNVLIAAGLLRKEGKTVACNEPYRVARRSQQAVRSPKQLREKQRVEGELRRRMEGVRERQEKLEKLQQKRSLIEFIITRNRNHQYPSSQCLRFPLLATPNSPVRVQQYGEGVVMEFVGQPVVVGDVDLLLQINRDRIEMDNLLEDICGGQQAE